VIEVGARQSPQLLVFREEALRVGDLLHRQRPSIVFLGTVDQRELHPVRLLGETQQELFENQRGIRVILLAGIQRGEQPQPGFTWFGAEFVRFLRLGNGLVEILELVVRNSHQIETERVRFLGVGQPDLQPLDRLLPLLDRRIELRDVEAHFGFVLDRQHLQLENLLEVRDRFFGLVRTVGDIREHAVDEHPLVAIESVHAELVEESLRLLWIVLVNGIGGGGEIARDARRHGIARSLLRAVLRQRFPIDLLLHGLRRADFRKRSKQQHWSEHGEQYESRRSDVHGLSLHSA